MDRPVFLSFLAVAVVAAAGLGALDAGTETEARVEPDRETPASTAGATPAVAAAANGSSANDSVDPPRSDAATYPPGTSAGGIDRPSKLLDAHVAALSRTGFVVRSRANATVLESGMRVDATSRGGARVTANGSTYYAHRIDVAGPLRRRTEGWYSGSVEHRRQVDEFGGVNEGTRRVRSVGELAGRPLLAPHLRGGAFDAANVRRIDGRRSFVLTARGVESERTLESGLPHGTTDVRSYEARLVVDSTGRIHSFAATVEYVVGGERATHHLEYDLARTGVASVERPEWVETAARDDHDDRWTGGDSPNDTTPRLVSGTDSVVRPGTAPLAT